MKKIELLAPAGSLLSAIVAFENGADAVYIGLQKLNARERAKNFTVKEYKKLLSYTKPRDKKVYITINTLIKESELPLLISMLRELADFPPDAVIIQDLAVYYIIKKYFPFIKIHASTQMGIHNSEGVKLLENMNFDRVILERQTTFDEIKTIKNNSSTELEVFIHGALCCSLSGMCLFSSWMGGHSGNRGLCKQPCRRKYTIKDQKEFIFSANDLSLIDYIEKFKEIGVASLKIEGRQKNESYVKNIVKAFRMVIDDNSEKTKKEAKRNLAYSFGRKWSNGFIDEDAIKTVVATQKNGSSGMFIGKIEKNNADGFSFTPKRGFNTKYILRIQPKNGNGGKILQHYSMYQNKHFAKNVKAKILVDIKTTEEINTGDGVYIAGINENFQNEIAIVQNLQETNRSLFLDINLTSENIEITVNKQKQFSYSIKSEPAKKISVSKDFITKTFKGTKNFNITFGEIKIDDGLFILEKELKRIRKLFETEKNFYTIPNIEIETIPTNRPEKRNSIYGKKSSKKGTIIVSKLDHTSKSTHEIILDDFVKESNLKKIIEKIDLAYSNGVRRFRITSIFYLNILKKYDDIYITTSFPIHIANQWAAKIYEELGVNRLQLAVELDKEELKLLTLIRYNWELYYVGKFPILSTRAELSTTDTIHDLRGGEFKIIKDKEIYRLYPKLYFQNDRIPINLYYDYSHINENETKSNRFNLDREFN